MTNILTTRSRRWTWTLNNWTVEERSTLEALDLDAMEVRYIIFGEEEAPGTGTKHLQGYTEFLKKKSGKKVKEMISSRIHLEVSRGNSKENREYCSKGNNIWEKGTPARPGKRKDLEEIKDAIDAGASEMQISREYFSQWVQYRRSFQAYRTLMSPPIASTTYTDFPWEEEKFQEQLKQYSVVLWGDSGIGKTEFALKLIGKALLVSHIDDLGNYNAEHHEGIVFDDMDFKHTPRSSQIHLTDMSQDRSIHIRYGVASIPKNTRKIFTTNEAQGAIFHTDDSAIRRRIKISHLIKH